MGNSTVFSLPGGADIAVPDDPTLMTPFVLAEQGDWFETEIRFIRRWLKPGMAVVDVGANYGVYTLTCAGLVGAQGRVWAYEPTSLPRSFLAQSIARNGFGHVDLIGRALSDHMGTARMGTARNAELNSLNEAGQSGETVQVSTIDDEAAAWDRSIDFVKLDAEGEEVRILSRSRQFFAKHHPLVMFEYKHGDAVNHELLQAIGDLGMQVYRHLPGLNVLVPLDTSESADGYLLNVFGCSRERARLLAAEGLLITEPSELPEIDVAGAESFVRSWTEKRPWTSCLWPAGHSGEGRPAAPVYFAALAELIRSEDEARDPCERLARARRGLSNLMVAMKAECNVSRLLSAARVAMDLGERTASVDMLGGIVNLVLSQRGAVAPLLPEPFLPPDRRHDDLAPKEALPSDVLSTMVGEAFLDRTAFSTYFIVQQAPPLLRCLAANPLRSSAVDRRISAARRLFPV
jgi:FkbM family methyltransferase